MSDPLEEPAAAPETRLRLTPGEVHVWYAWVADCGSPRNLGRYRRMLDPSETQRLDRLLTAPLKVEFLLTRALCRETLSRYANVPPQDWQFELNPYGKPAIAAPRWATSLKFNLSNTRTLVACAVVLDAEVGIDVERWDRPCDTLPIASQVSSAAEMYALRACPEHLRHRSFYELWTLKEAYVKARGMGMSIPLDQVSFVPNAVPIRAEIAAEQGDDARAWQFEQADLGSDHLLALAIRQKGSAKSRVVINEARL